MSSCTVYDIMFAPFPLSLTSLFNVPCTLFLVPFTTVNKPIYQIFGPALIEGGAAGKPTTFVIVTRDCTSARRWVGGDTFRVAVREVAYADRIAAERTGNCTTVLLF